MSSLGYIINTVAAEHGIDITVAAKRAFLLSKINQAARDLYSRHDLPLALMECYVRVTPNYEVALPPFVGELRAIRQGCKDYCTQKWELHTMYPRYNKTEWVNQWKNWRQKYKRPLAIEWLETAPGSINATVADSELVVTIVGQTATSNRVADNITMTTATKSWTSTFESIQKISKNKITNNDVILSDADGNECAIIYADQLDASYNIIDVSEYPTHLGCCTCDDGTSVMELLYKPRLPIMSADSDFFPVPGYDDALIVMTKQLLTELQEGKEQRALLMAQKANALIAQQTGNVTGNVPKKLNFKRNPFFGHGGREC